MASTPLGYPAGLVKPGFQAARDADQVSTMATFPELPVYDDDVESASEADSDSEAGDFGYLEDTYSAMKFDDAALLVADTTPEPTTAPEPTSPTAINSRPTRRPVTKQLRAAAAPVGAHPAPAAQAPAPAAPSRPASACPRERYVRQPHRGNKAAPSEAPPLDLCKLAGPAGVSLRKVHQ